MVARLLFLFLLLVAALGGSVPATDDVLDGEPDLAVMEGGAGDPPPCCR